MKLIKPSVEFLGTVPTDYSGALRFIERAGRTCYKSEDRITETSAEGFVRRLIKSGHLAMVEHSNFVVRHDLEGDIKPDSLVAMLGKFITCDHNEDYLYFGGSLTAWKQRLAYVGCDPVFVQFVKVFGKLFGAIADTYSGEWQICPHDEIPKELHRYSAKFICDRGVSHELVRHRPCSFAQESTRYVNYGGKDVGFIEPIGFDTWSGNDKYMFEDCCSLAERQYNMFLDRGKKPQQARAVLPNALKTEVIVTADLQEWEHIFKLRCAPAAHPDFRALATQLRDKFVEEGLI